MPPVGFEPTISAGERPKTYALDRAVTGTGAMRMCCIISSVAHPAVPYFSTLSLNPYPANVENIFELLTFWSLTTYIYVVPQR